MNKQIENDAERFLSALETNVQELVELSKVPEERPENISFDNYKEYREKSDECLSFLVIIEGRITEVKGERKALLQEQLDKLLTATWSVLLAGSHSFLSVLAKREFLPLGTRHIFEQELNTLLEAELDAKESKNQKLSSTAITEAREKAKDILQALIERAPQLEDVSSEESAEGSIESAGEAGTDIESST